MIKKLLIIGPILLVATVLAATQYFAHYVRMTAKTETPVAADDIHRTGIVVATGHDGRIGEGVSLLLQEQATRLLISGVGEGVRKSDIRRIVMREISGNGASGGGDSSGLDAMLTCCIDLGDSASDTEGNAVEARDWVQTHGLKHIIIVTSDFHMPRAMIAFERHFPKDMLVAHHVKTPWLQLDQKGRSGWWRESTRVTLIASEAIKYVARAIFS